jgi:phosphoribosylcarboxyaminoimidazole (NCAIR) mutase
MKLAHRYKLAPTPNCPLCGEHDSTGHVLGGCHAAAALRVARHDTAVRLIQQAIAKGSKGNSWMLMDAGKASELPEEVAGKRLPVWLLPSESEELRQKLRPDIVIVEGLPSNTIVAENDRLRNTKIHVIEVGYGSDTNHADKETEKMAQHQAFLTKLREQEFCRGGGAPVFYHVITLGRCGTVPASLSTLLQTHLGVGESQATTCIRKLHRSAVHWVQKFYIHRMTSDPAQAAQGAKKYKPAAPNLIPG